MSLEAAGNGSAPAEASAEGGAPAEDAAPAEDGAAAAVEAPEPKPKTDETPAELAEPEAESPEPAPAETAEDEPPAEGNGSAIYASPSVRRLARELDVELSGVRGSGRKGRITKEDVQSQADGGGAPAGERRGDGAVRGLDLAPWPKRRLRQVWRDRAGHALAHPAHLRRRTWPATG